MGKKGRSLNPTDAFRKKQRIKEKKKVRNRLESALLVGLSFIVLTLSLQNKKNRQEVRKTALLHKDPSKIRAEMAKINRMGKLACLCSSSSSYCCCCSDSSGNHTTLGLLVLFFSCCPRDGKRRQARPTMDIEKEATPRNLGEHDKAPEGAFLFVVHR